MAVTNSTVALDPVTQADGSRWAAETHEAASGPVSFYYLLPAGGDGTAIMQGRVASVNADLADREYERLVERDARPVLVENTAAQFAARLREDFREGRRERACYLAWWLLRRIAAGEITDAQCRTAFGLTVTQWNNTKTSTLTPRSDAYAAMLLAEAI